MERKVRVQRKFLSDWEDKTVVPLGVAAVIYMAAYTLEVLFPRDHFVFQIAEATSQVLWFVFAADVLMRFFNRIDLKTFFQSSWIEIAALILPMFRFLRILRLLIPIKAMGNVAADRLKATSIYTIVLLPIIIFLGAIAVIDAEESHPESKLTELKSALWWSFTTVTGSGNPDGQPVTDNGRIVTGILIFSGIVLVSIGAGMFASWILGETKAKSEG
jgi:voltage-gated potassium channel